MIAGQYSCKCEACSGAKKSAASEYSPPQIYQPQVEPSGGFRNALSGNWCSVSNAIPTLVAGSVGSTTDPYRLQIASCSDIWFFTPNAAAKPERVLRAIGLSGWLGSERFQCP